MTAGTIIFGNYDLVLHAGIVPAISMCVFINACNHHIVYGEGKYWFMYSAFAFSYKHIFSCRTKTIKIKKCIR